MKQLWIAVICAVPALGWASAQEPSDSVSLPSYEELDAVTVTASRPIIQVTADKLSYEAADDPEANSLSVLDLLRKVPGVSVDGQDNITLNGQSNYSIYVNSRPNPMLSSNPGRLLKGFPASVVQRIEVISSPGAEYDAEGTGGILNIVIKNLTGQPGGEGESMEGYNATFTATAGDRMERGTLYLLGARGPFSINADLSAMDMRVRDIDILMDRTQTGGPDMSDNERMTNRFQYYTASLGADWNISANDRLHIGGSFTATPMKNKRHDTFTLSYPEWSHQGGSSSGFEYNLEGTTKTRNMGINANADYTHTFGKADSGHTLALAYMFSTQPARNRSTNSYQAVTGTAPADFETFSRSCMREHLAQADYKLPFGAYHTFETGAKLTLRRSTAFASDLDYIHDTDIEAIYASYSFKKDPWAARAGLRYEHTDQKARFLEGSGTDFSSGYNNLVPSASISWSITPMQTLSASYDMRINRPGISYLNPYVNDDNPLYVTYGNPYLHPETYNNVTLSYGCFAGIVTLTGRLRYSVCRDGLTDITSMEDGISYTTYANSLRSHTGSFMLFANFSPTAKTRITLSSTTSYTSLKTPGQYSNHGWQEELMAGVQQRLPWDLSLSAYCFGRTRKIMLQGYLSMSVVHQLSLSRSFLKDRLDVNLMVMNPFYGTMHNKLHQRGADFSSLTDIRLNLRSVMVTVSYRLGSLRQRQHKNVIESDAVNASGGLPGTTGTEYQ